MIATSESYNLTVISARRGWFDWRLRQRYSSGMYVRLAFAVAAYLESEILIVDEVLAVGDVQFQNKCPGRMKEISGGEGRTVLFVSHKHGGNPEPLHAVRAPEIR